VGFGFYATILREAQKIKSRALPLQLLPNPIPLG